jgi:hypothetical protein
MTTPPFRNSEAVIERLRELHGIQGLSWPKIAARAEYLPIPAGTLCSIYHGYPIPKKWRKDLGLPKLITRSACHSCGEDHTTKRCKSSNHKKRNRLSINLDNPGSAGKSIMKHMDLDLVEVLIEMLMEEQINVLEEE